MLFARKVWHLLVAIKDGLVLLLLLLFFAALYGALTARPSAGTVHEGALLVKLDGVVVEEPSAQDPFGELLSGDAPIKEYRARDVAKAISAAASDNRIKAVVLDLSRFVGGGQVHMLELAAALDQVRAARKPVYTWALAYTDDSLLLAAHASEVWVDPLGGAFVTGPGGENLYYGPLLERLKIKAHVFKVGTFKDAVEPYIRDGLSDPSRAARSAIYGALWDNWKAAVAKARPKARIDLVTRDPAGWLAASGGDAAKAALTAGLVDKIGDRAAFGERVKAVAGADGADERPGAFAHVRPAALLAAQGANNSGEAIAVVTVAGEIVDGKAGPGKAGGERIARLIDEANTDDARALVLRIDSPGGSVFASEDIRLAVERFKARGRPVAVSMANLAASGGYWVSTPAQRIFAEPSTITGSIGVFSVIPTFEEALGQYGVKADGVRTTALSGQPDLLGGLTPEVERMLQSSVESSYARFVGLVATSRKRTTQQIDAIGQGRVWDGGTARQNGLVDQFGGLDDAIGWAAQQAKLESWHPAYYGSSANPYASLLERLTGSEEDDGAAPAADFAALVAQRQQAGLQRVAGDLARLLTQRGIQAQCLECPVPVRSARRADRADMLQLVRGWLAI